MQFQVKKTTLAKTTLSSENNPCYFLLSPAVKLKKGKNFRIFVTM